MLITQIDPYGCTCADCEQGSHISADRATFNHMSGMLTGFFVNNTGCGFVKTMAYGESGEIVNTIYCMDTEQSWVDVIPARLAPPRTRARFKREFGPTPPMADMTSDEMLVAILKYVAQVSATRDPALRARLVAEWLQPAVGELLRACVTDCRTSDLPWVQIGELIGTGYATVFRQFLAGGPMLGAASRVTQKRSKDSVDE